MSTKPVLRTAGNRSEDDVFCFFFLETPSSVVDATIFYDSFGRYAHTTFHRHTTSDPFETADTASCLCRTRKTISASLHGRLLRLSSVFLFVFASALPSTLTHAQTRFHLRLTPSYFCLIISSVHRSFGAPPVPRLLHTLISPPKSSLFIPPILRPHRLNIFFISVPATRPLNSLRYTDSRFYSTHHASALAFSFLRQLSSFHIFCLMPRHSDSKIVADLTTVL